MRYEEFPGHIECFRRGGPKAGRRVLMLHVLARGSIVEYYNGSHLHHLETTKGKRSWHEISSSEMVRIGSKGIEKDFADGGM